MSVKALRRDLPNPDELPDETTSRNRIAAKPIKLKKTNGWVSMGKIGIAMLFHDKLKLAGTLLGVVFAVLMSNFQTSLFLGLLLRNTMFVDQAGADIWITPPGTVALQGGDGTLPDNLVSAARGIDGVTWSAPLLMGAAAIKLPEGGQKPVMMVGTELPLAKGGPFHVVAGDPQSLVLPDAVFLEDTRRERFGGVNLGDVREVNGHRAEVVGFTTGLVPFGPPYAFASFDTAREMLGRPNHEVNYIMLGLDPAADPERVLRDLKAAFPDQLVMPKKELKARTIFFVLGESGIGQSIGMGVAMSVFCGFAIVALTMFSAVVDHLREFGTLKAIGATNSDLAKLLVVQAVTCAVIGVALGEALVSVQITAIRGAEMPLGIPWWLMLVTLVGMTFICIFASGMALMRVRRVEPAMVFRG